MEIFGAIIIVIALFVFGCWLVNTDPPDDNWPSGPSGYA